MQLSCCQSPSAHVLQAPRLALEGALNFPDHHVATVVSRGPADRVFLHVFQMKEPVTKSRYAGILALSKFRWSLQDLVPQMHSVLEESLKALLVNTCEGLPSVTPPQD